MVVGGERHLAYAPREIYVPIFLGFGLSFVLKGVGSLLA